ncbi:MAG: DUF6461 domain-containing protein [Mycobacteriales bacterium]
MDGHYERLLAAEPGMGEAVCVTYARGVDEDGFLRAFGGDPAAARWTTVEEAGFELAGYHYSAVPAAVLLDRAGEWLVGIEHNGFQGSRPEVLRPLSRGGAAVSVYWNVNGSNRFSHAVGGRRLVSFDMLRPESRHGAEPDAIAAALDGLPFGPGAGEWRAAGLALAETLTGVRLDRSWFASARRFRFALLRPVPEDLIPDGREDDPALRDPALREILAAMPDPGVLPVITRYVARLLVGGTGLDREPAAARALAALDGTPAGDDPRAELAALADRYLADSHAALAAAGPVSAPGRRQPDLLFRRSHALRGLAGALDADPAAAAREACRAAGYVVTDQADRLRLAVLQRCADACVRRAAG